MPNIYIDHVMTKYTKKVVEEMNNEERILSMLDRIASELQEVKQNSITKDEFQGFRQEVNGRFDDLGQRMTAVEQNMVTEGDLHKALADSQEDIKAMLSLVSDKLDEQDLKFGALNDRLFSQEI